MANWHQPRANRRVRARMGSPEYPIEPRVVAPVGSGKAPQHVSNPIVVAPLKRPLDNLVPSGDATSSFVPALPS